MPYLLEVRKRAPRARWYYAEGKFIMTNFWRTLILKPDPYTDTHTQMFPQTLNSWPTLSSAPASPFLMYSYSKLPLQCTQIYLLHAGYFAFTSSFWSLLFTAGPPALQILIFVSAVHYLPNNFLPSNCSLLAIMS